MLVGVAVVDRQPVWIEVNVYGKADDMVIEIP